MGSDTSPATDADISAATRAVPEELGGLLAQHGVDPLADSGLRVARGRDQRLAAAVLGWFGPVVACLPLLWCGHRDARLLLAAGIVAIGSLVTIRLLQRAEPGEPLAELGAAAAIAFVGASLPLGVALGDLAALLGYAIAGLVASIAMALLLPVQGRRARIAFRGGMAGLPILATGLFGAALAF